MAKARDLLRRIHSFGKTMQITKTMEMVAASRMKKTQLRVLATRPYANKLLEILGGMNLEEHASDFPLLQERETVSRVGLLVITSNRGLCGAFNTNVIRLAQDTIADLKESGIETELHTVGKKGFNALKYRKYEIASSTLDIGGYPSYEQGAQIARTFMEKFIDGTIDEFRISYASYRSLATQPPVVETILPLPVETTEEGARTDFLLEPSPRVILETLLPKIVENRVFKALLESAAGEQAARRIAMKNASDNAEEYIQILTRSYNRARQSQITQEIAEIVGGAEALV